jgi:hypothetical protein
LLDLWDKPFNSAAFQNFPNFFDNCMVTIDTSPTQELTDDDSSISSAASTSHSIQLQFYNTFLLPRELWTLIVQVN